MAILIIALAVCLDWLTKARATAVKGSIPLIKGVLNFTYTENTGAAFSIFSKHTSSLGIFSAVVTLGLIGFMLHQKKKNPGKKIYLASIAMIIGGALGNMRDRFVFGYVVDFIDFCLINFPVFNVADIFITIGGILFCYCLIFDKEIRM